MGIGLRHYDIAGASLDTFRTLDNSFRANRQEQALAEERSFQRERQIKADDRADEQFQWLKDEREIKKADEELGLLYADWKAGKQIQPSELARKRMAQLGVEMPLGPDNPQQALEKGVVSGQLLGLIERRRPELDQLPPGTTIPAGEIGQALVKIDPKRYSQTYKDDKGEYRVQPSELYLMRPGGKTSFALGLEVLRPDANGQWVGTGEKVPATANKSNGPDDQVSVVALDDLTSKLQSAAEFNKFYLDSMGTVENYLALKGNKQAAESVAEKKTLNKVTGLLASDTYKKAVKGEYAPVIEMVAEMAQQGLADDKDLAKALQLVTTKEVETTAKNKQDEADAQTSIVGYAGMAKNAPRTAAMASQLQPLIAEGKVSGKRASKMLDLVYAAEQKSLDRQATIAASRARAGGDGSTALIKNAEFMVQRGIAKDFNQAFQMLNTAKDNPAALVKTLVTEGIKNNAMLPAGQQKTPQQLVQEAREIVAGLQEIDQPPATAPTAFDQALILSPAPAPSGGPRRGLAQPKPSSQSSKNPALNFFR